VVEALYPAGGKLMQRWLHLLPAHAREHTAAWQVRLGVQPFPWQGWYNANFQIAAVHAAVRVPGGRLPVRPDAWALAELRVRLRDGLLEVVDPDGRAVVFADGGLEATETRPPGVQALWALTTPRLGLHALGEAPWTAAAPGVEHRARHTLTDLVLAPEAWRLGPDVWGAWGLTERDGSGFFLRMNTFMDALEAPRYVVWRTVDGDASFVDRSDALSVWAAAQRLRGRRGALRVEAWLPGPGFADRAWSVAIDPFV
jgi:hypothetical protein